MFKRLAIAAALATSASAGFAQTPVGDATLLDTATVVSGTVTPTTYLSYVSGSNGTTGDANGTTYSILSPGLTPTAAMATADHLWAQFDAPILMFSPVALSGVIAIPAIDHGWTLTNSGPGSEPFEPFEFRIFGCSGAPGAILTLGSCTDEGHITMVWTKGVDDVGPNMNADDWATQWSFAGAHNYFAIMSGDRLVGGPFSPGEGEIDALAAPAIPEPETYALFAAGLAALGFMTRRRRMRS